MTELKTLTDFGETHYDEGEGVISFYDLRQEAIKWIKADKSNYHSRQGKFETILWIKHFLNLTEEDLK